MEGEYNNEFQINGFQYDFITLRVGKLKVKDLQEDLSVNGRRI